MTILAFLSSTPGRWTRAIVGAVLIALGAILDGWWWLLAAPGLLFVLVGALDVCPVSYTHLTLPTMKCRCRSRWSPYH